MASFYDETLVNFDLDFLQPSASNVNVLKHDKQRQSILNVKKKIVASSALVQKFYTQKERLEETECLLLAAKEECKQACIENKGTLEKYTELEKNAVQLKESNQQLVKNVADLQTQVEAMNSHAYQLQTLVKEKESMVEALKIEKELEKSSLKDYEKKLTSYEKEREAFLNDIRCFKDVVLGKKKVKEIKHILSKYKDMKIFADGIESDNSSDLDDFDESPIRSPSPIDNILYEAQQKEGVLSNNANEESCNDSKLLKIDKFNDDHDSDFCIEVISEDTGRGSSLALSEMNSPETDFMLGDYNVIIKEPIIQVDVGTSPMRVEDNLVSSPNMFDDEVLLSDRNADAPKTPEYFISDIPLSSEIVTIKEKRQLVDACTSPVKIPLNVVHEGTSPIIFEDNNEDINVIASPIQASNPKQANTDASTDDNSKCQMRLNSMSSGCEIEISRKPIEEVENMDVNDEISNDREVQMILREMKFHHKIISPLPKRPKMHSHTIKEAHLVCPEAIKIREENKTLKTNVDFLCKEILLIKGMLTSKSHENIQTTESDISLFGDSQDTIIAGDNDLSTVSEVNNTCENSTAFDLRSNATECENDPITLLFSNVSPQKSQNRILLENDNTTETPLEADINCPDTIIDNKRKHETYDIQVSNDFPRNDKSPNGSRLKRRKQTKLDLLKRKIMPRSKIMAQLPARRFKKIPLKPIVKKDLKNQLLNIINNKEAYDKARQVMSELKSNDKSKPKIIKQKIVKKKENRSNIRNTSDRSSVKVSKEDFVKKTTVSNPIAIDSTKESYNNEHKIISPKKNRHAMPLAPSTDSSIDTSSVSVINGNENVKTMDLEEIIHKEDNTGNEKIAEDKETPIVVDNEKQDNHTSKETTPKTNRRRKRIDSGSSNVSYKRMLRSSNLEKIESKEKDNKDDRPLNIDYNDLDMFETVVKKENVDKYLGKTTNEETDTNLLNKVKRKIRVSSHDSDKPQRSLRSSNSHVNITDIDTDRNANTLEKTDSKGKKINKIPTPPNERLNISDKISADANNLSNSILCKMIRKHGKNVIKTSASKVSDKIIDAIFKKIDTTLSDIVEKPPDQLQKALDDLIQYLKSLNRKEFISGLMKFLQDPARKLELYNKAITKVPMTKKEQMIVYIIKQMNDNILGEVLRNIDFALFCLSRNPDFDTIESLSHIYAVLCRVFNLKNRLKVFMLDAMYCLNFKAVVVVKQCLITWPHVLPLAHLPHAKSPLLLSIVYLLHFLKCDNRGMKRATDVRWLLDKKYMYNFNEWNQNRVLEMFSHAIKTIRDDPAERNMLRMAIIIFAKRQGVKWCQKHIINNLLLSTIENENSPERVKVFCIKVLGPLFKAYPINMKVHCEIMTNRLLDMLEQENLSHAIKEGIFTSLICMSKHNPQRVNSALLQWTPEIVSSEFEALIKSYVREKPIKAWKKILSKTR
ncbi:uncharacterized protein LOC125056686 isoform X2 [Pieris napi]|uniref:uncharacterized protein LOC125056686 isoform X2 n=1 Tax=Pieris napi TaxID=78633 RepID=UPI001FB90AC8|nr:uncharacterized protein LOC125056686 isoform X2 [Pieris napi]